MMVARFPKYVGTEDLYVTKCNDINHTVFTYLHVKDSLKTVDNFTYSAIYNKISFTNNAFVIRNFKIF
jgi:hypothetical protein